MPSIFQTFCIYFGQETSVECGVFELKVEVAQCYVAFLWDLCDTETSRAVRVYEKMIDRSKRNPSTRHFDLSNVNFCRVTTLNIKVHHLKKRNKLSLTKMMFRKTICFSIELWQLKLSPYHKFKLNFNFRSRKFIPRSNTKRDANSPCKKSSQIPKQNQH